jgi:hypothetical protein
MEITALDFCVDIARAGPERRDIFDIAFGSIVMYKYSEKRCAQLIS